MKEANGNNNASQSTEDIEEMYNVIFQEMTDVCIAVSEETPVFQDQYEKKLSRVIDWFHTS